MKRQFRGNRKEDRKRESQVDRVCETCMGRGWIYHRVFHPCPDCNGEGEVIPRRLAKARRGK